MADQENIVIEVDGSQALRGVDTINRSLEGMGETVVRVSDRSKNSLDRVLSSMAKQADMYGKSGIDKLVAQRDSLIQRYGTEQRAVEAITKSYNTMIDVERRLIEQKRLEEEASARAAVQRRREMDEARRQAEEVSHFNANFAMRGVKDIFEGRGTYAAAEGFNVLQGLQGAPMLIGGTVAALGGLALAAKGSMTELADFGLEMENLHARTGIATSDLNQFSFAAKVVGQDATIYERMMRGLSQALGENSKEGDKARETMTRLAVDVRDKLTGELLPTTDVLLNISKALKTLPAGFQQEAAAMDLVKKAGIEAIPVLVNLADNFKRANELHLGISNDDLNRLDGYHKTLAEIGPQWDKLKRSLMEPLASVWNITLKFGGKVIDDISKVSGWWDLIKTTHLEQNGTGAPNSPLFGVVPNTPDKLPAVINSTMSPDTAQKAIDRYNADALIRSMGTSRDAQAQLKDAEANLSKLTKPEIGVSSLADAQQYKAAEDKVTQLKDQIKYTNELTEANKRLQSFENAMGQRDLSPTDKLRQQLSDFLAPHEGQARLSSAQRQGATNATNDAIDRELTKQEDEINKKLVKDFAAGNKDSAKYFDKEWEDVTKEATARIKLNAQAAIDTIKEAQKVIQEQDKSALERYSVDAQHQGRVLGISSRHEGFAGEMDAAVQALALKRQIRDVEMSTIEAHKGAYDIDRERARVELENLKDRYDMEEKILEVKKREFDEVEKTTEKLVNTLLTKPGSFGKELGDTVHAAILQPITKGISHVVSNAVTPLIFGKDGHSGLSGALGGVFGGRDGDPIKVSTDLNTTATMQNTAALYAHASAIRGGGSAGGGSSASGLPSFGGGILSLPGVSAPGGGWSGSSASPLSGILSSVFAGGSSSSAPGAAGGGGWSMPGLLTQDQINSGWNAGDNSPLNLPGPMGKGGGGGGQTTVGAFGGGVFGSLKGSLGGILGNLKGTNWGGFNRAPQGTPGPDDGSGTPGKDSGGAGKITGVNGVAGAALGAGGMALATQGLTGKYMGTAHGMIEGAAGGAMIGMEYGGPIGAAIGAGVGFGIGLGEMLTGTLSPQEKAIKYAKQIYGISISMQMAQQIVGVSQSKYGGNVALAVRDPETRKMLQLYATGTGQKFPLSAVTAQMGSLAEQGGRLYQQATYQGNTGQAMSFQSNLPVYGGLGTQQYPSAPSQLVLNVNGQSAADLLAGRVTDVVNPAYVQGQYAAAMNGSNGRVDNSANLQQPGLIIS